jgi:hypothetical protein
MVLNFHTSKLRRLGHKETLNEQLCLRRNKISTENQKVRITLGFDLFFVFKAASGIFLTPLVHNEKGKLRNV